MNNRDILNKLHEERGRALELKLNEIDELLKPHTKTSNEGWKSVVIPNKEIALKYNKLNKEFQQIVEEIRTMHQN